MSTKIVNLAKFRKIEDGTPKPRTDYHVRAWNTRLSDNLHAHGVEVYDLRDKVSVFIDVPSEEEAILLAVKIANLIREYGFCLNVKQDAATNQARKIDGDIYLRDESED